MSLHFQNEIVLFCQTLMSFLSEVDTLGQSLLPTCPKPFSLHNYWNKYGMEQNKTNRSCPPKPSYVGKC